MAKVKKEQAAPARIELLTMFSGHETLARARIPIIPATQVAKVEHVSVDQPDRVSIIASVAERATAQHPGSARRSTVLRKSP